MAPHYYHGCPSLGGDSELNYSNSCLLSSLSLGSRGAISQCIVVCGRVRWFIQALAYNTTCALSLTIPGYRWCNLMPHNINGARDE